MSNRIHRTTILHRRVSPMEAEWWVVVEVDYVNARTELRGRLVGPKYSGTETIQVAYPIRMIPQPAGHPENAVVGRIVIPEPNLWTRETPFYYAGTVELWQDEMKCDESTLMISLKTQ
jgi:hypothetical protein